jgi:sarcosine oxidase
MEIGDQRLEASLPREAYWDADFFSREQQAIFWRGWFYAGRAHVLNRPGDFRVLDVAGESVIVIRGDDDALHAHLNLCRHRGSRLLCGEGSLRARHKGELIYPNFMLSLSAEPDNRGVRFLVSPRRNGQAGFRSVGRGRFLGSRESSGLGDLCEGAGRHAFARVPLRILRADGRREPRHSPVRRKPSRCGRVRRGAHGVKREYDAIVLGLGGIGSGAAYWLARRGVRVLGIERFELGHARGESHDHSRIIRLSYHAPQYVRLAKEAYAAWDALHEETGECVVFKTGGLDLGPRNGAIALESYANAMRASGISFDELDAAEIRRTFPQFEIDDDVHALYQADGGIVAAERATAAHQAAARAHGATLIAQTPVTGIAQANGEYRVEAGGERYHTPELIVAAGPWTNHLLDHFGMQLPLEVTKEQATYFRPRAIEPFEFGRFPVWIWMDDPSFYGFPVFGEAGAVKVTQDAGGKPVDPDTRGFEPDPDITARVRGFLAAHLPQLNGELHRVKTCLYTLPPDRDFIIDSLPEHRHVHVAVGAGHAFKFASVIGRILSDLAIDGATRSDIASFAVDRPVLQMASPPKTYMV